MANRTCSLDGCSRPYEARGLCHSHYERLRRHGAVGDPAWQAIRGPEHVRLWAKVEKDGDCWLWTGPTSPDGYGRFRGDDGVQRNAHRVIWGIIRGPIPNGLVLDHHRHCPKTCVNPAHLRLTTNKQNSENRAGLNRSNTSGYANVSRDGRAWRVIVTHHGRRINGGRFADIEDAARAARALRLRLFTHNDIDRSASWPTK